MDNTTQLTVLVERCVMQINPDPFFDNSTLVKIRKFFRYVFQEPDRNTETISTLGGYLPAKVAEKKEAWDNAKRKIAHCVIVTQEMCKNEKRAKAMHTKYVKILAAFEAANR